MSSLWYIQSESNFLAFPHSVFVFHFSSEKLVLQHHQCIHLFVQGPYSQSYGFSYSHVQMWELDHNQGWVLKNWCFWIVVLGKTFESPLDNKEIKSVSPKGNQLWIVIGWTDAEAEAPILWPPDVKSWLIRKDPDAGKDWGRRRRRQQRMRWLDDFINTVDMSLSKL